MSFRAPYMKKCTSSQQCNMEDPRSRGPYDPPPRGFPLQNTVSDAPPLQTPLQLEGYGETGGVGKDFRFDIDL